MSENMKKLTDIQLKITMCFLGVLSCHCASSRSPEVADKGLNPGEYNGSCGVKGLDTSIAAGSRKGSLRGNTLKTGPRPFLTSVLIAETAFMFVGPCGRRPWRARTHRRLRPAARHGIALATSAAAANNSLDRFNP